MEARFSPDSLVLARQYRAKTQTDLAEFLGVSQPMVSKWEKSVAEPNSDQVSRIGDFLGFLPNFFLRGLRAYEPITPFHRKRQSTKVADQERAEAIGNLRLQHITTLAKGVDIAIDVPELDVDMYHGGANEVARVVRSAWRMPKGPVSNVVDLLEGHGIFVFLEDFGTGKMQGFTISGDSLHPVVFANSNYSTDSIRLTLVHELGHLVMHKIMTPDVETEAWTFADEFLMPEEQIEPQLRQARTLRDFFDLKHHWKISVAAIIRRAKGLGIISQDRYRSLMIQMAPYRKTEPVTIVPERPTLAKELIDTYLVDMRYTRSDLAKVLDLTERTLNELYPTDPMSPRLRLVK